MKTSRAVARRASLVLALAAVTLVTGCAGTKAEPQDPALLTEHRWALESYLDATGQMATPVEGREEVGISFENDTALGFSGVNSFTGPYKADDKGTIEIGPLASTMMAGPEPAMDMEQAFLTALETAATYRVSADSLELVDENSKVVAVFGKGAPEPTLENTDWYCTGYNNGQEAFVSILADAPITARFESGTVAGSSGVNSYSGSYTVEGLNLTIDSAFTSTEMAGSPEAMDQESAYLAALAKVKRYSVRGSELTLYGDEGLRLVTYSNNAPAQ